MQKVSNLFGRSQGHKICVYLFLNFMHDCKWVVFFGNNYQKKPKLSNLFISKCLYRVFGCCYFGYCKNCNTTRKKPTLVIRISVACFELLLLFSFNIKYASRLKCIRETERDQFICGLRAYNSFYSIRVIGKQAQHTKSSDGINEIKYDLET